MQNKIENKDHYFLFFILLLASVLRFYNAFDIPLTHDEFSALFRTDFDNFSDLIKGGVLTDTHPAGVQVFLFYWIKLVGQSAFAVKFPFILMGIGAVYFVWIIAKAWYNTSVAILSALLMATLEFPLMHSQIARPYISGLFLSLWMVYHWRIYLFDTDRKWNRNLFLFVLAGSLAAYNHHFSLLFAAIVGISGLAFISKKRMWAYITAGLAIFILYSPHLSIFFHQLDKGGVGGSDGWLGAPESDFIWMYFQYIFNYSWILLAGILFLFIASIPRIKEDLNKKWKFQVLFLVWFLIPLLVGYFYSVLVNPVIQYSVLIFSFPFLFFVLFGFIPDLTNKWRLISVIVLTPLLLYTTIVDRKYYRLFYQSPYSGLIEESRNFSLENKGNTQALFDSREDINDYYFDRIGRDFSYNYLAEFEDRKSFIDFISAGSWEGFSYGLLSRSDAMLPAIIVDHFPILEKKTDYNQGNFYAFSKNGSSSMSMYRDEVFLNSFDEKLANWDFKEERTFLDSLSEEVKFGFDQGQEWGVGFTINMDELDLEKNDLIDVRLEVFPKDEDCELLIVSEIERNDEKFDWRASSSKEFFQKDEKSHFKMYHCIKLSDLKYPETGAKLKIYLWNKGKTKLAVDDFDIRIRMGNPVIYGLLNKMN